jgi:hypothetical protein
MLDLGFQAVGRPNDRGGRVQLARYVGRVGPGEVVVVADNDPGGRGLDAAHGLVGRLLVHCSQVRVVAPPPGIKDARLWRQAGATREDILAAIAAAAVHKVSVTLRRGA